MVNNNQDSTINDFGEELVSAIEILDDLKDDGLYEHMETVIKLENKIHTYSQADYFLSTRRQKSKMNHNLPRQIQGFGENILSAITLLDEITVN